MNETLNLAIYARKSTESEDRQVLSIDSQVKELRDFARDRGYTVKKVFTEAKSAKAPGREVFNSLYQATEKGEFNALLCWKLDRLARNPVDGGALIWSLDQNKLQRIVTPSNEFTNAANDKFWMQLEFGMAKKYVDDLSDNTKRGLRAKIALGWRPGTPPIGYLNDRERKTIVKDPERFPIVREMWKLLLTGLHSPNAILKIATYDWGLRRKVQGRFGGGPLTSSAVYATFTNPFYCGIVDYGGERHEGAHEPMISLAEFEQAQRILSNRGRQRPKRLVFTYAGLMKCGECGASVTAERKQKYVILTNKTHHWVYYHCTKRKPGVRCSQRVIDERELEAQLLRFFESLSMDPKYLKWTMQVIDSVADDDNMRKDSLVSSIRRRIAAAEKERESLLDLKLRKLLTDDEFFKRRNSQETELIRLRARSESIGNDSGQAFDACRDMFRIAASAVEIFINGTLEDKRTLISQTCSNLTLRDKTVLITAKKPFALIKNVVSRGTETGIMFEPGNSAQDSTQSVTFDDGFCALLRLVNDVRKSIEDMHNADLKLT